MFNLDPPPDFRGLDPHKSFHYYDRHLPHWCQDGATYFVTFRLADSLPQNKLRELAAFRLEWQRKHPPRQSEELRQKFAREMGERIEHWLDQGMSECRLREPTAANIMASAMQHFDGQRYTLGAYVVMPNHVHCVVRPFATGEDALDKVLQSWKRHASYEINKRNGRSGTLWQEESFDRIVRDAEHLWKVLQYIGNNPRKAHLSNRPRWVSPEWIARGWKFEDASS